MATPLLLLLLVCSATPTPRVVVTFRNASLNAEAVAPDNMEVVKQYGRRLVLRVVTEDNVTAATEEWVQEALGGEALVERVETDVLAVSGAFVDTLFHSVNQTIEDLNPSTYIETNADTILAMSETLVDTLFHSANQTIEGLNTSTYIETNAETMLAVDSTNIAQLPTNSGWSLDESEPYALHIKSLRLLTNGRGAVMAILDSGLAEAAIALFHPAVGYDFVSSIDYSNKPNQTRNPDYTDPGDQGPTCPTASWHGTKVASVAMAIAPGSTLSIMRVLGQCGVGFSSDIADAIVWAAGGQINGLGANPYPATVISLSLAGKYKCPSYLQSAVNQARSLGATVIAAAGNAAQNVSLYFPANCIGVIAVGASTRQGTLATYSNWGTGLAFSAQGGDTPNPIPVLSISNRRLTTTFATGTSFAAPHVAGTLALLVSLNLASDSIVFVPSLKDHGQDSHGYILSTVTTYTHKDLNTIPITTGNVTVTNLSSAFASGVCPGSTDNQWRVAHVIDNVIFTFGALGEIPLVSGTEHVCGDCKTEEFNCPPGCFITQFTVCPGIKYIIVHCSDGTSSNKYGHRDYAEQCTAQQQVVVTSPTGFVGIKGVAGNDVNGMDFYIAGGGTQLAGCADCQKQTSIQCGSHPDQKNRILTGFKAHFSSGGALHLFGLLCSVYTCPPGEYMTTNNRACNTCNHCAAGKYVVGCGGTTFGTCTVCTSNCGDFQYKTGCSGSNPGTCTDCGLCDPGNSFSGCTPGSMADTHTCIQCEAGKHIEGGWRRSCISCDIGTYNPNPGGKSYTACRACPTGKYNLDPGSAVECKVCGAGKYNPLEQGSSEEYCLKCTAGTYGANTGAVSSAACVACPAGKYSIGDGESTCLLCAAGTYGTRTKSVDAASCTACGIGKYSATSGASTASTCTDCPAGKYNQNLGGASIAYCSPCIAGTNAEKTGTSQCTPCTAGKYNAAEGLSAPCVSCDAGKYNGVTGGSSAAACQNCVKGSYGHVAGLSVCLSCTAGTYAAAEGLSSCTACAPGSYTANTAQSMCDKCTPITNCHIASESTCLADYGDRCVECDAIYACVYDAAKCFSNGKPACLCNPGFEMVDGKCSGCGQGKYKDSSGSGQCMPITTPVCSRGTYLRQGTAFANSICVACPVLPSNAIQGVTGCDWSCAAGFDNNAP